MVYSRRKVIICGSFLLLAALTALWLLAADAPFAELTADEVESVKVLFLPRDESLTVQDPQRISAIVGAVRELAIYRSPSAGGEDFLTGRLVRYTLTLKSGRIIEIDGCSPTVRIDGRYYQAAGGSFEALCRLGESLLEGAA